MALTGIKIPISVQLDAGDVGKQVAVLMSSLQAQLAKGLTTNINVQVPKAGATAASKADPGLAAPLTAAMNSAAQALNQAAQSMTQAAKTQAKPSKGAGGPPAGGGGGGRGPQGPQGPAGFGQGFRGAGRDERNFLGTIRSVAEYRVASRATNALFNTFDRGVSVVSEVQNEMTQLNKILNTNKANLEGLKRAAIDTAKEFGKSTTSVLQGFRVFAQQGLPAEEVKKLGRTVALASNVSTFGTEGLSELITAGRKTFGDKEVGSTGLKLIDKFLAVEGARAVSEGDLADVFKRIGPQAAAAGISVDQLNALTTVVKERTRSESGEIATALRFIIKNLQDTRTQKNIKAIKGLEDIQFTDPATGDLKGTFDVLDDISKKFSGLDRRGQLGVATQIGETRFASRTIALLEGLEAGEGASAIDISKGASGEALRRNQIVMQSISKQAEQVGTSFDALALSLGEGLVGPTKVALGVVREILDVLTAASQIKLFGGDPKLGIENQQDSAGFTGADLAGIVAIPLAMKGIGKFFGTASSLAKATTNLARTAPLTAATSAEGLTVGMRATQGLASGAAGAAASGGLLKLLGGLGTGILTRLGATSALGALAGTGGVGAAAAAATPVVVGAAAVAAATALAYTILQRLTESSKDRADRLGLTNEASKGRQTVDFATALDRSAKQIEQLTSKRAAAEKEGSLANQQSLVAAGVLDRTTADIDELINSKRAEDKRALLREEDLVKKVGGKVTSPDEILFKDDSGKLDNIFKNNASFKNLTNALKSAGSLQEQKASSSIVLSDFFNRLKNETAADPGGDVAQTFAALTKLSNKEELSNFEKALLNNERETGKITKDLAGPDLQAASSIINKEKGRPFAESLDLVPTTSKKALSQLLAARTGSKVRDIELNNRNLDVTLQGLLKKTIFQDLASESAKFKENVVQGFAAAGSSADQIKNALAQVREGDIVSGTKDGKAVKGRVVKDATGALVIDLFSEIQGEATEGIREVFGKAITEQLPQSFAQSGTIRLDQAASVLTEPSIVRPEKTVKQLAQEFLRANTAITGFGAGQTLAVDALKLGPQSLSELSSQAAGAFTGLEGGVPKFNQNILSFLTEAEKTRSKLQEDLSNESLTEPLGAKRFAQVEAGNLIGTAVSKLGEVFKQFSVSVDKLLQFRIDKKNAKTFSTIQTGEFAKAFGTAAPQVALGPDKADLDPLQRALLLLPQQARSKEESDFRLGELKQSADLVDFNEAKLSELVSSASSNALSLIDSGELRKLFSPLIPAGPKGEEVTTTLDKILGQDLRDIKPGERQDLIKQIDNTFKTLFSGQRQQISSEANAIKGPSVLVEASLKTAVALSSLQIAAEQSSRALQALEKFQSFDQALVRARGEGPLGAVNKSTQPVFFKELDGRLSQINLAGKNQFEIEKEMLRLRSSEEVRSGKTRILDSSGQALSPITDEQLDFERRNLKIREKQARGGFDVSRQRQQLETNQQVASDFINRIGETLATKDLDPKARTGLEQIQKDLIGISERPEKDFISKSGKINLQPFDMLKGLDKRVEGLVGPDTGINAVGSILNSQTAIHEANKGYLATIASNSAGTAGSTESANPAGTTKPPADTQEAIRRGFEAELMVYGNPPKEGSTDYLKALRSGFEAELIAYGNPSRSKILTAPSGTGGSFTKEPLTKLVSDLEGTGLKRTADLNHRVRNSDGSIVDFSAVNPVVETLKSGNRVIGPNPNFGKTDPLSLNIKPSDKQTLGTPDFHRNFGEPSSKEGSKAFFSNYVGKPENAGTIGIQRVPDKLAKATSGEQMSKALDSSGTDVANKIESAISTGGNSFVESLNSVFGALTSTLKSLSNNKSVGGSSVTTSDVLGALTERVSSIEASRESELSAIREGVTTDFEGKISQLDSKLAELKERSESGPSDELKRETSLLMSEMSSVKGTISKVSQSSSTSEQEVTVLKAQILGLESRLAEASSLAQKALGLATTAWGNTR